MSITMEQVMAMEEMQGAYYIAGFHGRHRKVNSTTVLDAPDGIRFLKGNEFVFSTMYPYFKDREKIKDIIEELALRNISGLGLNLDQYLNKLPLEAKKMADKYKLPVIILPPEKAWIDMMIPIMSEVLKINNRQLIKSRDINKQFTKALLLDSSLKEIAELLYYHMEAPVAVYSLTEDNAVSFPEVAFPSYRVIVKHLQSAISSFERIDDISQLSSLTYKGKKYHVLNFNNASSLHGAIVVEQVCEKLDQDKISTLLHAKNASIIKLKSIQVEKEYSNRFKQDFIADLLVKHIEEKDLPFYHRKARELGLNLHNKYMLLAVTTTYNELGEIYQLIDRIKRFPECNKDVLLGFDKKNHLIILIPIIDNELFSELMPRAEAFISQLQKLFTNKESIGVSQILSIESIPSAYEQGIKALYHGIKIGGYGKVQFYDNLGIYRLFSHPAIEGEIKVFVNELLEPLFEYERENNINLVETLRIFIENRGNYRKTGEILHLHHNSVRYRINVIDKLTNFNIDNHNLVLQFQLALSLLPMIDKGEI